MDIFRTELCIYSERLSQTLFCFCQLFITLSSNVLRLFWASLLVSALLLKNAVLSFLTKNILLDWLQWIRTKGERPSCYDSNLSWLEKSCANIFAVWCKLVSLQSDRLCWVTHFSFRLWQVGKSSFSSRKRKLELGGRILGSKGDSLTMNVLGLRPEKSSLSYSSS